MMLDVAFQEWAVICQALGEGRQSVLIRKGGIAESGGEFRPEHTRFLLLPTHYHERQRTGIKPELLPLLDAIEARETPANTLRFTHSAEVANVLHVTDPAHATAFEAHHGWTEETIRRRFHYRTPGLYVLLVRVYELSAAAEIRDQPAYAGCKTWVKLDESIDISDAKPVLSDAAFRDQMNAFTLLTSWGAT